MSDTKHTPGPWTVSYETDISGIENDPANDCVGLVDVAHVYMCTVPGRHEANARLIAAAPDMLAALIVAREFVSTDRNSLADASMAPDGSMDADDAAALGDYDQALLQIDAAIQKATRETK